MSDAAPRRGRRKRPPTPRWLRYRFWVQLSSFALANSYVLQHYTKGFCYPVLNCWSCPGANFACPIGALGNASISARHGLAGGRSIWSIIPLYVIGTMFLFMGFFGRMMCGWLCPFGWLQEQFGRLRRRKMALPMWTGYFRYAILVVLVFIVPYYTSTTWFCKLCPAGALEGGLPQPIIQPGLRAQIAGMWWIKQAILLATLGAMLLVRRPFCGLACPLGALFSLFHRYSAWQARYDVLTCTNCEWCVRKCPQGIDPRKELDGFRCVGCLECQKCPYGAIESRPIWRPHEPAATEPGPEAAA